MALERRKFTQEFKLNAVHLVVEEGRVARQVADELGIPPKTLYNWLALYRQGTLIHENSRDCTPDEAEKAELRAKVRRLEQELALVKKFAAYLSTNGLK